MEFQLNYFKSEKMLLLKSCTKYASKFGTLQWPQDRKWPIFMPILKKGNAKEYSNYQTIALISHASKIILKIRSMRNRTFRCTTGFWKGKGTRNQITGIHWIIEKAREFQKIIYFCFTDDNKAFDCVDHKKLCKILKEKGLPDNLTCLLRRLYAGQEARVRTIHGTTDWFQIGKGVHQDCVLSACIFNFYAEYIMWKTGLDDSQAVIKIAREISLSSDM